MSRQVRIAWCVVRELSCVVFPKSRIMHHAPRAVTSLLLLWFAIIALPLAAQPTSPHIGYIYPAGGRVGTTFYVVVGGQFLNNASNPIVTGDSIQAQFVEFNRPMPQKEFNDLRDKWRELTDRRRDHYQNKKSTNVWTTADEQALADLRMKLLKNPPNRTASPAIADTVTLKVDIGTNAAPGDYELRLGAPNGLSNPLKFCVGDLPEFSQAAVHAANPDLDKFLERLGQPARTNSARATMRITLPSVLNGQIAPGGIDRFRFSAHKGQRIVVSVSARDLIPYLADAVPGWFQAAVSISDLKGQELAYDDHFRFHPDPVLCCEIPRDGDYVLQIRDSIYRGREDFVYRITVGEIPFVTSVFPLGGKPGEATAVAITGWNLTVTNLTVGQDRRDSGVGEISFGPGENYANIVPFAFDTLPEVLETEPNDTPRKARAVTLPVIINGRIDKPGDADVFSIEGRAGQEIVAEVTARRLNSPLDSTLELTDAAGKRIAFNDDFEDKGSGLETHHADSYLRATLPAAGKYYIRLTDSQRQGGPEFGYRLRISEPQPDFALRIAPSSVSVRAGANTVLDIYALRKDGFTNAISFWLKDAPSGFAISGGTIPANQDQVRFTLTAPPSRQPAPLHLEIAGHADIDGKVITHTAVPCEDMMQAFAYRHLVPAKALEVTVGGQGSRANIKFLGTPVRIPVGGKATVRVTGAGPGMAERALLDLSDPPDGISLGTISAVADGIEVQFVANDKVKAGIAGNLILAAQQKRNGNPPNPNARRVFSNVLPAIPFEVVKTTTNEHE